MSLGRELPSRTVKQTFVGGENFAGAGVTNPLQTALRKIYFIEGDCGRVGIRVAGDLAKYPVAFA